VYEIVAAIVGRATRHHCTLFHLSPRHDELELVYPFWILRRGAEVTLVDTGFALEVGAARGIYDYRDPSAALAALGIAPGEVGRIILSHLHYDHFGVPERYPNARFVVQYDDVAYFAGTGRAQAYGKLADPASIDAIDGLRAAGRLELVDGDRTLEPGLSVVRVGGHTPGSQVIAIDHGSRPLVLACDASHFYANEATRTPSSMIYHYEEYQRGFATIARLAAGGRWFPGHDPAMLDGLAPLGEGLYRCEAT
jgi:glyoxylase-like metal-dependent hydrolase (beta-lactamase superfamily II)